MTARNRDTKELDNSKKKVENDGSNTVHVVNTINYLYKSASISIQLLEFDLVFSIRPSDYCCHRSSCYYFELKLYWLPEPMFK